MRGIYPILDTAHSRHGVVADGEKLLAAGAEFFQLRAKGCDISELLPWAEALAQRCEEAGARLIVNDSPSLAQAAGAHGVHLGQDDGSTEDARALLGPDAWIGRSVDTPEEARRAAAEGADYIAWGAVFPTSTKPDAAPQIGAAGLKAIRAVLPDTPLVAIGGIDAESLGEVIRAGANAVAVIGALYKTDDISACYEALQISYREVLRVK